MQAPVFVSLRRSARWRRRLGPHLAARGLTARLRSTRGPARLELVLDGFADRLAPALRALGQGEATLDDPDFGAAVQYALAYLAYQQDVAAADVVVRPYNDVSAAVVALDLLVDDIGEEVGVAPLEVALRLAAATGTWREPLLVAGRRLLDVDRPEEAAACARRALGVMSSCQQSQRLLLEATGRDVDLRGRFCGRPFEVLVSGQSIAWDEATGTTVQESGATYLCDCAAWLPAVVGNVVDAEHPDEVWNSPAAQEVRRSILDGDFAHCSRTLCPLIVNEALPLADEVDEPRLRRIIDEHRTELDDGPQLIALGHDSTCNLACPSCRTGLISASDEEVVRLERARDRVILPLLRDRRIGLHLTAWGDPFASRHYRSILEALGEPGYEGVQLQLLTNGLGLRPKVWSTMPHLARMVTELRVSVDAASKATYEDVRRPGRWEVLRENLTHMGELNRLGTFDANRAAGRPLLTELPVPGFSLGFVVQQANYREMPDFVRLGEEVGADAVVFQRYYSFGHESAAAFAERDVSDPGHPEHAELRRVLDDPTMRRPIVSQVFLKQLA